MYLHNSIVLSLLGKIVDEYKKKSIYVDGDVVIPVNMSIQVLVTFMRQVVFYISIQHF